MYTVHYSQSHCLRVLSKIVLRKIRGVRLTDDKTNRQWRMYGINNDMLNKYFSLFTTQRNQYVTFNALQSPWWSTLWSWDYVSHIKLAARMKPNNFITIYSTSHSWLIEGRHMYENYNLQFNYVLVCVLNKSVDLNK